ncbi:MAG: AAA family ATPase [Acidimicrobiales bacterium]
MLIVDEASTISDRDLDALLDLAERTGAALRLIGDPAQHGAVGAGGMFRVLCEQHPDQTVELTTSHRVQNEHDRAAATALREGRIAEAFAHLRRAGHLHEVTGDVDIYLDLLTRWWEGRQSGRPHPMVDRSNHSRRQLNRLARRLLQAHDQLGPDPDPGQRGSRLCHRRRSRRPSRQPPPPPARATRRLASQRRPRHRHRHHEQPLTRRLAHNQLRRARHHHRASRLLRRPPQTRRPHRRRARPRLRPHQLRRPRRHLRGLHQQNRRERHSRRDICQRHPWPA